MRSLCSIKAVVLVVVAIGALMGGELTAQIRQKTISPVTDTIALDTVPVALASLKVLSGNVQLHFPADFTLDSDFKRLIIKTPGNWDSLYILWQRFPDWLLNEQKHRSPEIHHYATSGPAMPDETGLQDGHDVLTDGILLRGISFGNAQDLVLNSSLNLRMQGQITKDIRIEGAVTDQEFPFQPEGTTTTLQDFDRIYVALHLPRLSVLLGDYAYQSPASARFLKFSKKNRGLQLKGADTLGRSVLKWEATAALARGRFSRNEISGIEGLQGPYRLVGARGEQFVIVVSGTEVVYLDGKKMERGLQADYVIDYNTGEVTFTPAHIITAFSRIVVEFQYSDRFYTRSVAGGHAELERKKATYYLGMYSEQDARNQPIQQDLEAFDSSSGKSVREILAASGDNPALAVMSGARILAEFSTSEPNYIRRDTGSITFYEHVSSPDTHKVFYRVSFTYAGPGRGTYVIAGSAANGKVYRYVGLISGVPAGDYEPVMFIQPPSRLSVAEGGVHLKPGKHTTIQTNVSVTHQDRNLFSPIDDGNNQGAAAYLALRDRRSFRMRDSGDVWYFQNTLQMEQTSAHFTSVERYRDVEFGRNWNRSLQNPENGLNVSGSGFVNGGSELGTGDKFAVFVNGGYNRSAAVTGQQWKTGLRWKHRGWFLLPLAEWSHADLSGIRNEFQRRELKGGYEKKQFRLELLGRDENSIFSNNLVENLPQNYGLREWAAGAVENGERRQWSLTVSQRINRNLKGLKMEDAVLVGNLGAEWSSRSKKSGHLKLGLNFRKMELLDTFFKNLYSEESHMAARGEYQFSKLFRYFSGNLFYQSISGREQQRQYSYFEVPAGQGYFTWVDFNNNGIREVNEFQETPFRDQARFVRLLVPTGNYIKAQGTEFNGNINFRIQPGKESKKGVIQNKLTWNYNGKSASPDLIKMVLPFTGESADSTLLAYQGFLRNLAEYEAASGKWLAQFTVQWRGSKVYFTNGFDHRNGWSRQLYFRADPGKAWQIRLGGEWRNSTYNSEFVPQNSFQYVAQSLEPGVTFQPGSKFRVSMVGKTGIYHSGEQRIAELYEGGFQWNLSLRKSSMLELRTTYLKADYRVASGTPLAYDILQGFSSGNNFRGIADLRFSAGKNIQIVMSYEGRKTADARFIHVGRAEARYLF